jgi:hypothetical protein
VVEESHRLDKSHVELTLFTSQVNVRVLELGGLQLKGVGSGVRHGGGDYGAQYPAR